MFLQFLERKNKLFTTIAYQFCVHMRTLSFRSTFLFRQFFPSVLMQQHHPPTCGLGHKSSGSVFGTILRLIACPHGKERNHCVSFHFSYHLFYRSTLWTAPGMILSEAFPFRGPVWTQPRSVPLFGTERYGTEQLRSCAEGLRYHFSLSKE